jgi:hypothetical protein
MDVLDGFALPAPAAPRRQDGDRRPLTVGLG